MSKYILIPEEVKINKNISPGAKILYGDILYLSKKNGYCFAGNDYFSKMYNVHSNSITNWVKSLKENNLISTKYQKDEKGRSTRRLYPTKSVARNIKKRGMVHTNKYGRKTKVVI